MKRLTKRFQQAGIMSYFYNEQGIKKTASLQTQHQLFNAFSGNTHSYSAILPPVKILYEKAPHFIKLHRTNLKQNLQGNWHLQLENQQGEITGKVKRNTIYFPQNLPLGYHDLTLAIGTKTYSCRIIIAPKRCYQPQEMVQGKKLWGSFIQLYSLKSEHNWGVGDFGDLKQFLREIAATGADFVGLNPIHALFPANPESASPYSPSSRRWLNILYIDLNALPEFQQSQPAQQWFQQPQIQQTLEKLRTASHIQYREVMALKLEGLRLAFSFFQQQANSDRQADFEQFLQQKGESLIIQATFDALHQHLSEQFPEQWGWNYWATQYQDYHSETVAHFQQTHQADIRFYAWLQFIAETQLKECDELCKTLKMPIGLYRDLAVGVSDQGAETWCDKQLYCLKASIGAPPDILAPQGQNWGLSPLNPHILQQRAYQPFIDLVQSNLNHCGALRIDHIMSLLRLWWIPKNGQAQDGAYIRYPVDDLIAILALESHRHKALIIGEDLGTVPKAIVSKLKNAGILSYKVFYFEFDEQGKSRDLADYPYQAMTTLSTHDLPTIDGYWRGYDFELGQRYGIYPNEKILAILQQQRQEAKAKILARLIEVGVEPDLPKDLSSPISKKFNHQLQAYVGKVESALLGLQPEDWINMSDPVNIPGTSTQYPNWRRRLSQNVTEIFNDPEVQQLLQKINTCRKPH
ncbi:4-alpha-glucanotransferase [uncultured Avibacterium sp.]|uniref:4-alpha-glucanotransferase n=1 Tax=uncultured Avibacterium sp. TaxID=1936169 RepID=A0A486XDV2_9PAST|nr:4-alpha-glucanotransferase [uncultured Avibacterium sp.]